ncbi:hypothetical protein TRIP_C60280 [Candidatus Zixiibacteriota bacterium]|nr:hypothetical protein TRIP_C60280 [candidate division Zixibacteria bacterium]
MEIGFRVKAATVKKVATVPAEAAAVADSLCWNVSEVVEAVEADARALRDWAVVAAADQLLFAYITLLPLSNTAG